MKLSKKLLAAVLTLSMVFALMLPVFASTLTHVELTVADKVYDGTPVEATAVATFTQNGGLIESGGSVVYFYTHSLDEARIFWYEGLPTEVGTYYVQARFIPDADSGLEESVSDALEVTIYAAAETEGDFEIQVKTEKEARLYEAYQLLTGIPARDDLGNIILTEIAWGNGVNEMDIASIENEYVEYLTYELGEDDVDNYTVYDVVKYLLAKYSAEELAQKFGRSLTENKMNVYSAGDFDSTIPGYSIVPEEAGYYLIREVKDSLDGEHASATWFLLGAVDADEPTVLEPKEPTDPTVDKFVANLTDDLANADWKEQTTANFYENVLFRLDAFFPFNRVSEGGWEKIEFEDFDVYSFTLHDVLPEGLTYAGNLQVFTNGYFGQAIDPSYYTVTVKPVEEGEGTQVLIHFDDLSAVEYFWEPDSYDNQYPPVLSSINVVFEARVNGNGPASLLTNRVWATYPNDPNHPEEEDGKTPEADASVRLYAVTIEKVDAETGATLGGASFNFYKLNADGSKNYLAEYSPSTSGEESLISWLGANENAVTFTTSEQGGFIIMGLAAGTYYLEEINAPTGYNKLTAPVEIKLGEDENAPAHITVTVENEKGLTLPSTGGMGTTLLYALGAVLLLGG
ncbi:MAG: hypothetical protein IKT43_03345, partial [Clostridia bacterium]|nr:hypothetical protein [Clostridia bacterium]